MHVVEALGGGVQSAINYWTAETPEHSHVILGAARTGHETKEPSPNAEYLELPQGHLQRIRAIASAHKRYRPDILHVHSSIAGVYVRLNPGVRGTPIIYSPHCFAFERTDITPLTRWLIRLAESLMSLRTTAYVTVSQHEGDLAANMLRSRPTHQVLVYRPPDVSSSQLVSTLPAQRNGKRVVAIGRANAQKDPLFMARAMRLVREAVPDARLVWIGDGEVEAVRELQQSGVAVTGWMPREEVLNNLRSADVFVHSAAWEGSPVVIEEALAFGVPVVARRLPVLESRGIWRLVDTPEELARHTVALLSSPNLREKARRHSEQAVRTECQGAGDALRDAYSQVTEGLG